MIYSDWHFCQNIQLSPHETAEYLDALYTLRENTSSLQQRITTLEKLRQMDELRQSYAIPDLVDLLLLPASREWKEQQENRLAAKNFWSDIKQQLKNLLLENDAPAKGIYELVDSLDGNDEEYLLRKLEDIRPSRRSLSFSSRLYLETNLFAEELLYLTLLSRLSRVHPDGVKKITEKQHAAELFQVAVDGKLGTLPQRLALDILLNQGVDAALLMNHFPEDWMSLPEYMDVFAQAELCASSSDSFERIAAEITRLEVFQRKYRKGLVADQPLWFGTGTQYERKEIACAVLWQSVLWELAWETDSSRCTELASELWRIPNYRKSNLESEALNGQNWITRALYQKFGPAFIPQKASPKGMQWIVNQVVCTPWQRYTLTDENHDGPFYAFHRMRETANALQAFSGASLLRRIFSGSPDNTQVLSDRNLLHVLLNLGCALESCGPHEQRSTTATEYVWSFSLRGLGCYAHRCLTLLGTGIACPELPGHIWNEFQVQLDNAQKPGLKNTQLLAIYGYRGLLLCAHWVVYAQSFYTVGRLGDQESSWEEGSTSYITQICRYLFAEERQGGLPNAVLDSVDAMHLYCKAGYAHRAGYTAGTWYERISRGMEKTDKISTYDLLREPVPEAYVWEPPLYKDNFTQEAWQYVLTMRLQALLTTAKNAPAWFSEWYQELSQNADLQKYPIVFYALMDILSCRPNLSDGMDKHCLSDILELIVGIIDIYTDSANAYFQYRLGEALAAADLGFGPSNLQKACASHLAALQRLESKVKYAESLQCRFIGKLLNKFTQDGTRADRGNIVLQEALYDLANVRYNDFKVQLIQPDGWKPYLDRFVQSSDNMLRTARLQPNLRRVNNAFLNDSKTSQQCLGIVEAPVHTAPGQNRSASPHSSYYVSLGDVKVSGSSSTALKTGDLVFYDGNKQTPQLYRPKWDRREKSDILRVWIKSIHAERGVELREVRMDRGQETRREVYLPEFLPANPGIRERLLKFWAPDTCSFDENGSYLVDRTICDVMYHESFQYYVPVERNFCRLMLDAFYGKTSETVNLWYITSNFSNEGVRSALFSRAPGFNYRLLEQDWDPESHARLEERLFQTPEASYGVAVRAVLDVENGFPHLRLSEEDAFDSRNQEWAELFSDEAPFTVECVGTSTSRITRMFQGREIEIKTRLENQETGPASRLPRPAESMGLNVLNVEPAANGWSITQQRKKELLLNECYSQSISPQWCTVEHIRELLELDIGKTVQLSGSPLREDQYNIGYYRLFLQGAGIPVYCSAESLSLNPARLSSGVPAKNHPLVKDRLCVVENIWSKGGPNVPDEREAIPVPLPEIPDEASSMEGILTDRPISSNQATNLSVGVTALLGDQLYPLKIPASAFTTTQMFLGSNVVLTRNSGGWTAKAFRKNIYVRALWSVDSPKGNRPEGDPLGVLKVGPNYQSYYVTQDPLEPLLHLWPESVGRKEEYRRNIFNTWTGYVQAWKQRWISSKGVFRYAQDRCVACLEDGNGKKLWGETGSANFQKPSNAWRQSMQVFLVAGLTGDFCYDVRREFFPRKPSAPAEQPLQQKEEDFLWYREWYHNIKDRHLIGKLVSGGFLYEDHKIPDSAVNSDPLEEEGTYLHPLLQEEPLWVNRTSAKANGSRARARMIAYQGKGDKEERWYASCRQAEPFALDNNLPKEFGAQLGELIVNWTLYFAGVDEASDRLRFEWGYGYTLLAKREQVVDIEGCTIGFTLFYGDYIDQFKIELLCGTYVISVPPGGVHHDTAMVHLWRDSTTLNIVQLMKVKVDCVERKVTILKISMAKYDIEPDNLLHDHSWSFEKFYYGQLEEQSKQLLLSEAKEEQSVQTIFVMLMNQDNPSARQYPPRFQYLSLNNLSDISLLTGKTLCLVAGCIESSRDNIVPRSRDGYRKRLPIANDYFVRFYLPNELPLPDQTVNQPRIVVSVSRRKFSIDESKLRVLYEKQRDFFFEHEMLVRLEEQRDAWSQAVTYWGSVRGTCIRRADGLRKWVQGSSACLVTLGDYLKHDAKNLEDAAGQMKESVLVEVAPGITSVINKENVIGDYKSGATAHLKLEEDTLKAYVILPGDKTYIPAAGRAAELLIMDRAAKEYAANPDKEPDTNRHFTVASFPQITLPNSKLLVELIQRPWPRLGIVSRNGDNLAVCRAETPYACIHIDEDTQQPVLYDPCALEESGASQHTAWSRLSYMDKCSHVIADIVRDGCWHYHDWVYAFYSPDTKKLEGKRLPASEKDYRKILVFPDTNGGLRVPEEQFRSVGYSAREIVENGLPKRQKCPLELQCRYAVAGVDENSIWIEAFPGRIVELPKQFLFVNGSMTDLEHFPIRLLAPGDQIELTQGVSFEGGHRRLEVVSFRYGLRSNLRGLDRAVLPVQKALPDGITMGSPVWNLTYPLQEGHGFHREKMATLTTSDNLLVPGGTPRWHDMALLGFNPRTGVLVIRGWDSMPAEPSGNDDVWTHDQWLRTTLDSPQKSRVLFHVLESDLPVTITKIDFGAKKVLFSYNQPEPPEGEAVLYCECIGFLNESAAGQVLGCKTPVFLLRAGALLLSVESSRLLPGLRPKLCARIAQTLKSEHFGIWIHRASAQEPWQCGTCSPEDHTEEDQVELLYNIVEEQGILCQSRHTMSLKWLPYFVAAPVGKPYGKDSLRNGEVIWTALQLSAEYEAKRTKNDGDGRCPVVRKVRVMEGCQVSMRNVDRKKGDSQWLKVHSKLRVTPLVELESDIIHHCIAEVYPQGELICLDSEQRDFTWGEPQPAEIVSYSTGLVRAVRPGMQREPQLLSKGFHKAYRLSHTSRGELIGEDDYQEMLSQSRWTLYKEAREKGKADAKKSGEESLDTSYCSRADTGAVLIYLYSHSRYHYTTPFWRRMVFSALRKWLETDGNLLLIDFGRRKTLREVNNLRSIDAVTAMTAALLLYEIGEHEKNPNFRFDVRKLAVHSVRMLGLAAEASVHQEVLMNFWFELDNSDVRGAWTRLSQVTIGGELTDGSPEPCYDGLLSLNQYYRLVTFSRQVLSQNLPDMRLRATAASLLHSVKQLEDFDEYEKALESICQSGDHLITWELAKLGRTLVPKAGEEITDRLEYYSANLLKKIWADCWSAKYMVPLLLHTPVQLPSCTDILGRYNRCKMRFAQENDVSKPYN